MRNQSAKTLVFVGLVAALAVPQPLRACCMAGGEHKTCCRQAKQSAEADAPSCCRKATSDDNCGSDGRSCLCCRSADPRIASVDRVADNFQPDAGTAYLAVPATTPDADFSIFSLPAPPGGQAAIPHRILHCSWLI
jgi:hypothetical protein